MIFLIIILVLVIFCRYYQNVLLISTGKNKEFRFSTIFRCYLIHKCVDVVNKCSNRNTFPIEVLVVPYARVFFLNY